MKAMLEVKGTDVSSRCLVLETLDGLFSEAPPQTDEALRCWMLDAG